MAENDYQFKVTALSALSVALQIDVNANDSFDDAQRLAENAIRDWFQTMFREYAPQKWPTPVMKNMAIEVIEITGNWSKGENSNDK